MFGLLIGAGILGVIITVMEEGDFPGWKAIKESNKGVRSHCFRFYTHRDSNKETCPPFCFRISKSKSVVTIP